MEIKCPKCKYEWNTKSKMNWITCPHCQLKFKRKNSGNIIEEGEDIEEEEDSEAIELHKPVDLKEKEVKYNGSN